MRKRHWDVVVGEIDKTNKKAKRDRKNKTPPNVLTQRARQSLNITNREKRSFVTNG